ncbi:MAG TPA: aspartate kinase [Anaerohalosphaeraceae bacterium]|jgi:aspartate kinase|nr:aspartate kinase [Anaerohalosphaeraceae bacterium]HRT49726.1 aspartate kinase [Anaerohalosphaeraceae bacterium]HRT87662.1 aspartate kinase [Anaerohalosphaeraceae bacterium]
MGIIVQKFGGTSVANADKIRRAATRAVEAFKKGNQVVAVASARGQQTDELIADAMELNPNPPRREMDMLLSTGEQQTVSLFAMALDAMGQKAISFNGSQIRMLTDGVHTRARIISIDADVIRRKLDTGHIVIVAGFQGVDAEQDITTLGRGGSDTSAVALAAALKADVCEIYTDVDGIYTSDPRKFPGAVKMARISYDEMLELASLGAGVMHSRSIEFGKKYGVPIHVRSSLNNEPGTLITHEVPQMEGILVSGATIQKDLAKLSLIGVDNKPGNAAKIFSHLAKAKVIVNDIIQTEISAEKANISFTVGSGDLADARKAIDEISEEVHCQGVFIRDDIAEVSVVGVGMRSHYGVAEKMFKALADAQVNIDSITTSEIRISCIVSLADGEKALVAVCEAFELDKPASERKQPK